MTHFLNHAARCGRVGEFHSMVQAAQPKPLDDRGLLLPESNGALLESNFALASFSLLVSP
jgi:hypothetical protein